jgi:hypothetical protein
LPREPIEIALRALVARAALPFAQLRGQPPVFTKNLGSDLSRPAVVSPACSHTSRSFFHGSLVGFADMFVAVSASFRLLYVMIILAHGRRRIVRFDVTQHPTAAWLSQQVIEAFPWDIAPSFLLRDRDASYGSVFQQAGRGDGHH